MIVHGREIKFLRTVEAAMNIADICPDGDLRNIAKLFEGTSSNRMKNMAHIIVFMNEGYEKNRAFEEEGYKPNPMKFEEVISLNEDTFNLLFSEATGAYMGDVQTVEVEEPKKKEEEKTETLD